MSAIRPSLESRLTFAVIRRSWTTLSLEKHVLLIFIRLQFSLRQVFQGFTPRIFADTSLYRLHVSLFFNIPTRHWKLPPNLTTTFSMRIVVHATLYPWNELVYMIESTLNKLIGIYAIKNGFSNLDQSWNFVFVAQSENYGCLSVCYALR